MMMKMIWLLALVLLLMGIPTLADAGVCDWYYDKVGDVLWFSSYNPIAMLVIGLPVAVVTSPIGITCKAVEVYKDVNRPKPPTMGCTLFEIYTEPGQPKVAPRVMCPDGQGGWAYQETP